MIDELIRIDIDGKNKTCSLINDEAINSLNSLQKKLRDFIENKHNQFEQIGSYISRLEQEIEKIQLSRIYEQVHVISQL